MCGLTSRRAWNDRLQGESRMADGDRDVEQGEAGAYNSSTTSAGRHGQTDGYPQRHASESRPTPMQYRGPLEWLVVVVVEVVEGVWSTNVSGRGEARLVVDGLSFTVCGIT